MSKRRKSPLVPDARGALDALAVRVRTSGATAPPPAIPRGAAVQKFHAALRAVLAREATAHRPAE